LSVAVRVKAGAVSPTVTMEAAIADTT